MKQATAQDLFLFATNTGSLYGEFCATARMPARDAKYKFSSILRGQVCMMYSREYGLSVIKYEEIEKAGEQLHAHYVRHVAEIDNIVGLDDIAAEPSMDKQVCALRDLVVAYRALDHAYSEFYAAIDIDNMAAEQAYRVKEFMPDWLDNESPQYGSHDVDAAMLADILHTIDGK